MSTETNRLDGCEPRFEIKQAGLQEAIRDTPVVESFVWSQHASVCRCLAVGLPAAVATAVTHLVAPLPANKVIMGVSGAHPCLASTALNVWTQLGCYNLRISDRHHKMCT